MSPASLTILVLSINTGFAVTQVKVTGLAQFGNFVVTNGQITGCGVMVATIILSAGGIENYRSKTSQIIVTSKVTVSG